MLTTAAQTLFAFEADWSALDEFLEEHARKFALPGAALVIVDAEGTLHQWNYGEWTDMRRPYFLGSVSKAVTAATILQLISEGRIESDQRVGHLLPEITFTGPAATTLSISHLLNHTSGLSRRSGFIHVPDLDDLADAGLEIELSSSPGTTSGYSNLNYVLLGLVVERATRERFGSVAKDLLFNPLEMGSTYASAASGDGLLGGHQYWFGIPIGRQQPAFARTAIPAGFIASSPVDMGAFLSAHLADDGDNAVLLPGDSASQARIPKEYSRVAGWRTTSVDGERDLHMSGATATSYAFAALLPASNLGFVFMTNLNAYNPIVNSADAIPAGILTFLGDGTADDAFPFNRLVLAGFGLLLIAGIIDLSRAGALWVRTGAPIQRGWSSSALVRVVATNLLMPIAVAWLLLRYFEIGLRPLLRLQPDIARSMILGIAFGLLAKALRQFTKQVHRSSDGNY